MSNSRKAKQASGGKLTRPRDQWGPGRFRTGERQGAGSAGAIWRRAQRSWAIDTARSEGDQPSRSSPLHTALKESLEQSRNRI